MLVDQLVVQDALAVMVDSSWGDKAG